MKIVATHNKDELKLIVELVFKTEGLVVERVVATSLLQRHKQGCHVNTGLAHKSAHAAMSSSFHLTSLVTDHTAIKTTHLRQTNSSFNWHSRMYTSITQ